MDFRGERVGRNESYFRAVNEDIDQLSSGGEFEVICECADTDCMKLITIERGAYEAVRRYSQRFVVFPEHVEAAVEDVVRTDETYWVVEKRGEAADVAEQLDPRS